MINYLPLGKCCNTKRRRQKLLVVALLCVALVISVSGCGNIIQSSDNDNSELYSFIIPKALFGGKTAEDQLAEVTNPEN